MKATDQLLTDHKLIRKLLEALRLENPRFRPILKTLTRAVVGHAWFEDEIFLPSFERRKLLHKLFSDEIVKEHADLQTLLDLLIGLGDDARPELEAYLLQFRTIIDTHFKKEEDALFPLAERILSADGLLEMGSEMERRKDEIRPLVKSYY